MNPELTARALRAAAKFSALGVAREAAHARRRFAFVPILLGDDGCFWVPQTYRDAGRLMRAGYEAA